MVENRETKGPQEQLKAAEENLRAVLEGLRQAKDPSEKKRLAYEGAALEEAIKNLKAQIAGETDPR